MLLTRSSLSFKINRIHLLSLYLLQLLLTVSLNGHNDKSTRVAVPSLQWKFVFLGLSLLAMTFSFLAVTLNFLILFYSPQGFATRVVSPQQHMHKSISHPAVSTSPVEKRSTQRTHDSWQSFDTHFSQMRDWVTLRTYYRESNQ